MSTPWFKTDLSADGGQLFQRLFAAANSGGAKEIFALDASGQLWHAYEQWEYISFEIGDRRYRARRIGWAGPNGKIWQSLSKFSQAIVDFAVTTDQYGALNIFAMTANAPASTGWLAQQTPEILPPGAASGLRCSRFSSVRTRRCLRRNTRWERRMYPA